MNNIIPIDFKVNAEEFKHTQYKQYENGAMSVGLKRCDLEFGDAGGGMIVMAVGDEERLYTRQQLSEFIQVLDAMIDDEGRYKLRDGLSLVSMDYEARKE